MRRAALMMIGLALAGCSTGDGGDKAGTALTTAVTQVGTPLDAGAAGSTVPGAVPPVDGAAGAPGPSATTATSNPTNGAPGASGGSATATGSPVTGTGTGTGTGGGGTTGTTAGDTGGGASGNSPGGSSSGTPTTAGGSGAADTPPPTIYATEEECAALRQVLAVIDHPDLRQLAVQANCV